MRKSITAVILFLCFMLIGSSTFVFAKSNTSKTTVRFKNGAVYVGQVKNGVPDGNGTMTWSKDKKYEGHWSKGKRDGFGTFTQKNLELDFTSGMDFATALYDSSIYTGNWRNNEMYGKGTLKEQQHPSEDNSGYSASIQTGEFRGYRNLISGAVIDSAKYASNTYITRIYQCKKISYSRCVGSGKMFSMLTSKPSSSKDVLSAVNDVNFSQMYSGEYGEGKEFGKGIMYSRMEPLMVQTGTFVYGKFDKGTTETYTFGVNDERDNPTPKAQIDYYNKETERSITNLTLKDVQKMTKDFGKDFLNISFKF